MTTIAFDTNWLPTEVDSKEANLFITRSDNGNVRIHTDIHTASPYSFGSYLPNSAEAFAQISELLKPVEEMPHFKSAWESFNADFDPTYAAQYLKEEIPALLTPSEDELRIFAKLYVSCFPTLIQIFDLDYFLYDGFYGYSNPSGKYCDFFSAISYREMVETALGVWQKDIAREFRNLDVYQAQLASDFCKFLHPNRLASIMHDAAGSIPMQFIYDSFDGIEVLPMSVRERLAFQTMAERVIPKSGLSEDELGIEKEFDTEEFDTEDNDLERLDSVADALEMIRYVGKNKIFKGARTWNDVHDRAMRLAPDIDSDKIITIPKSTEKLSEISNSEVLFEPLLFPKEFVDLGKELNICIGKASYFFKSLRGESYCFKVIEDSQTVGALEIAFTDSQWKVVQLQGRANRRLINHDTVIEHIHTALNS